MIVYEHQSDEFSGSTYDQTYAEDAKHYSHKQTFAAIDEVLTQYSKGRGSFRCLDLGCGQGQVLAYIAAHQALGSEVGSTGFYGLDISRVAIHQCHDSYPQLNWIQDSFQEFLNRPETHTQYSNTFDLVVNKGGLTVVSSEGEYGRMLRGIHSLLSDGGAYLYIQNKAFYQQWCTTRCREWSQSVFDIAESLFGDPEEIDSNGYYRRVYVKRGRIHVKPHPPRPTRIEFAMDDGSNQNCFIGGDELMAQHLAPLLDSQPNYELCASLLQQREAKKPAARDQALLNLTTSRFRSGRPTILVSETFVRLSGGRLSLAEPLYDALEQADLNVLHFSVPCNSVRTYCTAVDQWLDIRPDVLILGVGLEDHSVELPWNKPRVELDEFRHCVDYVLDRLTAHRRVRIGWMVFRPTADFVHGESGWMTRQEAALPWMEAAKFSCAEHGVPCISATIPEASRPDQLKSATQSVMALIEHALCGVESSS